MDVFIITGASKGIGFNLSKQLTEKGKKVIGIARTKPEKSTNFVVCDLANTDQIEAIIGRIIEENEDEATTFTLVNNAGIVDPIGLIGGVQSEIIVQALAVNLTAPMILSNAFIAKLKNFSGVKRILNISSGAGRKEYEGWGTYCTTKAGVDHFSRVIALEQKNAENPVQIVSIAPGIIDTSMQEVIRSSAAESFPLLEQFIHYKEQGLLSSPEETAEKLLLFLENEDFEEVGPIADIRNY